MAHKSLHSQHKPLANPKTQLKFLSNGIFETKLPHFSQKTVPFLEKGLRAKKTEILQLNLGYMCNQVCAHCHVDAGPDRKEIMSKAIMQDCLTALEKSKAHTLDLTGGAPEMNPDFRWLVEAARKTQVEDIIVRSNLTILRANKKYFDLPEFFAKHKLHVVSSLPYYKKGKTDKQRGQGVFDSSILALQKLNEVGYGIEGSGLLLDLVYNPAGAFLPTNQKALESDFKKVLFEDFNIKFNRLLAITNLPISRFLEFLVASENYEDYMEALVNAFNPAALQNVMCTNTLSVGYDGRLFDCDFNQMLNLEVNAKVKNISNFDAAKLEDRPIETSQHCYGCTAGEGSSCQGAVIL